MGQETEWDKDKMVEWLADLLHDNGELAYLFRLLVEAYAQERLLTEDFTHEEWAVFAEVTRAVFARCAWAEEGLLDARCLPKDACEDLFIRGVAAEEPVWIKAAFREGFEDNLSLWKTLAEALFKAPDYGLFAYTLNQGYINPFLMEEIAKQAGNEKAAGWVRDGRFEKKHGQRFCEYNDEEDEVGISLEVISVPNSLEWTRKALLNLLGDDKPRQFIDWQGALALLENPHLEAVLDDMETRQEPYHLLEWLYTLLASQEVYAQIGGDRESTFIEGLHAIWRRLGIKPQLDLVHATGEGKRLKALNIIFSEGARGGDWDRVKSLLTAEKVYGVEGSVMFRKEGTDSLLSHEGKRSEDLERIFSEGDRGGYGEAH